MSFNSKIEWTEDTWNPVTGCTKISAGCQNCYAERMARRLQLMGNSRYKNGFSIQVHDDLIDAPLNKKKSSLIFVNSMSDLFHEGISDEVIKKIFETMNLAYWHTFQILTKRSERLLELSKDLLWTENIWMGVTVENDCYKYRIDNLRKTSAHVKFVSFEPLIGAINDAPLQNIHWAIVGGESGPYARPIEKEWIMSIKEKCDYYDTAFYFKQWGGTNKKKTGRILLGQTWDNFPKINSETTR